MALDLKTSHKKDVSEACYVLTWSPTTTGLPLSRLLKLALPRLAVDTPLMAGPGPSLPGRSGRIRTAL